MKGGKRHHRSKDMTGFRVGYLMAKEYAGSDGKKSLWRCLCDCGAEKTLPAVELTKMKKQGVVASCGCKRYQTVSQRRTTHGMSKHPAFAVWRSMLARCQRPSHFAWKNYGGRGITVCERWQSFEAFWEDMGPSYRPGLSLERINNNGPYSPDNCRWATSEEQTRNQRRNRLIDTPRGRMTVAEAAREFGIGKTTLHYRIQRGITGPELLDRPDVRNRFTTSETAARGGGS